MRRERNGKERGLELSDEDWERERMKDTYDTRKATIKRPLHTIT